MDTSIGNQICERICKVLPTFGIIILITLNEPYLVLHTEEFFAHLHAFIVQGDKPIPIVF